MREDAAARRDGSGERLVGEKEGRGEGGKKNEERRENEKEVWVFKIDGPHNTNRESCSPQLKGVNKVALQKKRLSAVPKSPLLSLVLSLALSSFCSLLL